MHSGSRSGDRLPECFVELTWPCSGLWQLDIKQLNLAYCKKLDMNSTVEKIAFNFKNIETLQIARTNVTVLTEGRRNLALPKLLIERFSN